MRFLSCIVLLAAALLTACSSSPQGSGPATPTPGISPAIAREAASPDANFDMGFSIQITDQGFHPYVLVAPCCKPITWTNRTKAAVSIVFAGTDSGPIPPGGKFTYKPANVQAIAYHSAQDPTKQGRIQVNPTGEP